MAAEFDLKRLGGRRRILNFDAGPSEHEVEMTRVFREQARKNVERGLSATWVLVSHEADNGKDALEISGFISMSVSSQSDASLGAKVKSLPRNGGPVLFIQKMSTSVDCRGKKLGYLLMNHAFDRAVLMRRQFGCLGIILDAKKPSIDFYLKCGFEFLDNTIEAATDVPDKGTAKMFIGFDKVVMRRNKFPALDRVRVCPDFLKNGGTEYGEFDAEELNVPVGDESEQPNLTL